jgi:gliding motility-associated-like protein
MDSRYIRFLLIFCSIFLSTNFSLAQGEANNWYFGNGAGLTFNTNPPSALNGQLFTNEGCSSISAPNGDLLFYTDGRNIWDANNQIMPNANYFGGTGLNGDPSSTSSGLIVPHPTQENLYFVFTVDEPHHNNGFAYPNQGPANPDGSPRNTYSDTGDTVPADDDGFNNGFNYSVVDMTLNGGLGDVVPTQKNIELITYDPNNPEDLKYKCGEKITAVRGEDCESVWVITHFKDTFYAFKIDENGIDETPVISQVGPLASTDDYRRAAIGYLKASPDGDRLICANQTFDFDPVTNQDSGNGNIMLFDFDNNTGVVSNPLELISNVSSYGVEFSPAATKAYATLENNGVFQLTQWDLEAADVPGSAFIIPVNSQITGAIQLAPNGKIYRTIFGINRLAVINNPEAPGPAVGYSESLAQGAISLGANTGTLGLPPFIQSLFSTRVDITGLDSQNLNLCDGEAFTLFFEDTPNASFEWRRDGDILPNDTSSSLTISQPPGVALPYSESYTLTVDFNDGSCPTLGAVNVTYNPPPDLNEGFINECTTDFNLNTTVFDLTEANAQMIEDGTEVSDYTFTYFETALDAQNNQNPIENIQNYTNISTPQEITVVIENTNTKCINTTKLTLDIVGFDVFEGFELKRCDDEQNGIQTFDLTEIETIENIQVDAFYLTENDALNEINAVINPSNYQINNPYVQDLFFRIENETPCNDLGVLTLEVITLPPVIDETVYYCVEDFPNPIVISAGIEESLANNFEYLWVASGETTREIEVNTAGEYEVAVTSVETGCTNFRVIEVVESGLAEFQFEVEEFEEERNSITVFVLEDSLGNYEYAINADGPYQDSNVFENLLSGFYDIYVRDKNGCGVVSKPFGILGIMEYFTPNGDGINDVWTFRGNLNNKEAFASVYIFDRYGKLLQSFIGLDKGWDGRYNGIPMPSQDYWYRIELSNGRVLTGNFTLKR